MLRGCTSATTQVVPVGVRKPTPKVAAGGLTARPLADDGALAALIAMTSNATQPRNKQRHATRTAVVWFTTIPCEFRETASIHFQNGYGRSRLLRRKRM
jgi:hypothetical protein